MGIGDVLALLTGLNGANVFILIANSFFLWKLYTNHLPHLEEKVDKLNDRLTHLYEEAVESHAGYDRRIATLEGIDEAESRR